MGVDNKVKNMNICDFIRTSQRLAAYITTFDIDSGICNKVNCPILEIDEYDCVDCVIKHFSKACKWEYDEVCVNDKSEWCADFIDNVRCGRCEYYE